MLPIPLGYSQAHSRLRVYGESVAFFGGDAREGAIIHSHYEELMKHAALMVGWLHLVLSKLCVQL